jgi:DNA-binding transcriptional MocR family regulator
MTVADFLEALATLSGVLFVVTSMLAMGLGLTMPQIIEPLKNVRLVILALLANFVLVPLLAYGILFVLPLEQSLEIGLIVLSTAAGAPFLPKLVQGAKGNVAFGVGLMVLLMVITIIYLPFVLPLLLPGVSVNPWDIDADRAPPYARLDEGQAVIDCSMLTPAVGPLHARLMAQALAGLAADLPPLALTSYRPRVALGGFVEAMEGWLRLCGVAAGPDRIVATNGATSAMTVALMTATSPGDLVVTETLGHHALTMLLRHLGVHTAGLPLDAEGIVPDAFDRACREMPVKALYTMPAGLGATAATMGPARRAVICEVARRHDVLILENDAWGPMEPGRPPPLAALAPERVFYFTGLSKCLVPGLRLGVLVSPEPFAEAAAMRHLATNGMASAIMAEIGTRWLKDGTAASLLDWQRRAMARRNGIAARGLEGLGCRGGERGLHVWLPLPEAANETDFVEAAMRRGVAVAAGSAFAAAPADEAPRGVRICLGSPSERDLARACETVATLARAESLPASAPA